MKRIKRYFATGLLFVIPVFLTLYFFLVIFKLIDGILGRFLNIYLRKTIGFPIPGLGFLLFFLIILAVGFLANRVIGKKILPFLEKWFSSLPLISKVYPAFKQIVHFVIQQKELGFKKVVYVEYPSRGIWSFGFLTNEQFCRINEGEMSAVFVPSSPNPLTGYVIFVPREEMRIADISVSDALNTIISGGIYKPEDQVRN